MLEKKAGFIKRSHFKRRPNDKNKSWQTELSLTLLPQKVKDIGIAIKSEGNTRKRKVGQKLNKPNVGPSEESVEAQQIRLAAVVLQHSTNWRYSIEDLLFQLKRKRLESDDRRLVQNSQGSVQVLKWLIENFFAVNEFGAWKTRLDRIDQRGFKAISMSEYRSGPGCSLKQLRVGRSELVEAGIL